MNPAGEPGCLPVELPAGGPFRDGLRQQDALAILL
jgi:hypothetical protein